MIRKAAFIGGFSFCLCSIAGAQTGVFDFSGVSSSQSSQNFTTTNGFGLTVNGLFSNTALSQTHLNQSVTATAYHLASAREGGIGSGPFADGELRNGAGTPKLNGASFLELSNFKTPTGGAISELDLNLVSVDKSTHEGFLVFGSNGDAASGKATDLTLLKHGFGNAQDRGSFKVGGSLLQGFKSFYVTADNGFYSSVALGSGTKVKCAPVPEPATFAVLALGVPFFLRRKKKA